MLHFLPADSGLLRYFINNMKKEIEISIEKESEGKKIEHILKVKAGLSETLIRRLKRTEGGILLNGKPAKIIEKVSFGDLIKVAVTEKSSQNIIPVKTPLDIIYEDEDILAVNKLRSMPTHPSKGHREDTLANGVIYYLGKGSKFHVITRLDRDTSGVVLIAKNPVSAAFLTDEMKNGRIAKEYVAVINGVLNPQDGIITAPIKKKNESGILRCVSPDGKEAVTKYKTVKIQDGISLVNLFPVTGRTHQLRVHMSYMNCPIYGDSLYGAVQKGERTLLHCRKISFIHPVTKENISITAPWCDDIEIKIV